MRISDWSSDVCSSDLAGVVDGRVRHHRCHARDVGLIRHDGRLPCIASVPEPEGCSKYCFWARMRPASSGRTSTRSSMLSGTMLTIIAVRKIAYSSSPGLRTMQDRKSVVEGKGVDVRVDHGGRRI